jgi:hypothetical protein
MPYGKKLIEKYLEVCKVVICKTITDNAWVQYKGEKED